MSRRGVSKEREGGVYKQVVGAGARGRGGVSKERGGRRDS